MSKLEERLIIKKNIDIFSGIVIDIRTLVSCIFTSLMI